jgi:hypothetical protein
MWYKIQMAYTYPNGDTSELVGQALGKRQLAATLAHYREWLKFLGRTETGLTVTECGKVKPLN